jgi:menaquinone-dependent protoporphyrinogen oxidase
MTGVSLTVILSVMNVLVAYASKRGSTEEIARAVAETLRNGWLDVDCLPAADVGKLDAYDAVVLGSAVYMRRWRGDARRFLREHAKGLERLPFWVFSSGPVGEPSQDNPSWLEPAKTIAQAARLGARGHVVFGGRVPAEPHGPIERAMAENCPAEYRDRRDWDEIRTWAAGVARELRPAVRAA